MLSRSLPGEPFPEDNNLQEPRPERSHQPPWVRSSAHDIPDASQPAVACSRCVIYRCGSPRVALPGRFTLESSTISDLMAPETTAVCILVRDRAQARSKCAERHFARRDGLSPISGGERAPGGPFLALALARSAHLERACARSLAIVGRGHVIGQRGFRILIRCSVRGKVAVGPDI